MNLMGLYSKTFYVPSSVIEQFITSIQLESIGRLFYHSNP